MELLFPSYALLRINHEPSLCVLTCVLLLAATFETPAYSFKVVLTPEDRNLDVTVVAMRYVQGRPFIQCMDTARADLSSHCTATTFQ